MEFPVVQIDHEAVLCDSQIRVVKEVSPSFLAFAEEVIDQRRSVGWQVPEAAKG